MSSHSSVPFADLTLTVDGVSYDVSRYALARRSRLLAALFEGTDAADAVQDAWTAAPKGPQSTFALLLKALYTGLADVALPTALLDYFMTTPDVRHGCIVVQRILLNHTASGCNVIPLDQGSATTLETLRSLPRHLERGTAQFLALEKMLDGSPGRFLNFTAGLVTEHLDTYDFLMRDSPVVERFLFITG